MPRQVGKHHSILKQQATVARKVTLPKKFSDLCSIYACGQPDGQFLQINVFDILNEVGDFNPSYPVVTGREGDEKRFNLAHTIPHDFRPARTLLDQLERKPPKCIKKATKAEPGTESNFNFQPEKLIGLLSIDLPVPIQALPDTYKVNISARTMGQAVSKRLGSAKYNQLISSTGPLGVQAPEYGSARGLGLPSLQDLYGTKTFTLTGKDLKRLEKTTHIRLGRHLPVKFYRRILEITSNAGPSPIPGVSNVEYYYRMKGYTLEELRSEKKYAESDLAKLLTEVEQAPREFGFSGKDMLDTTMKLSMTELTSEVCISQEGYFMFDKNNQITPVTKRTIHIVAASGIDFNDPVCSRRELAKYFNVGDNGEIQNWKDKGKASLKERLKETYDLIYTSCKAMGVTHPSLLAMGLGIFLSKFNAEDRKELKQIYHEAQFELLCDKDYSFQVVFMNPAGGISLIKKSLENRAYALKCPIVLHAKDAKQLAIHCAENGFKSSLLCPSDPIGMMQGYLGYWWEGGYGRLYATEMDMLSTSTAVLGRVDVTTAFSDETRIKYHPQDERSMLGSNGTMLGVAPSEIEDEYQWTRHWNVAETINDLAESLLTHQPSNLEQHIIYWGLDRILKKWTADKEAARKDKGGDLALSVQPDNGYINSVATIKPDLRGDFSLLLEDMMKTFSTELQLDETERKLLVAQQRLRQGGMTEEEAKEIMMGYCTEHSIATETFHEGVDLPTLWAIEEGHQDLALHLIKENVQITMAGLGDNTPLHSAVKHGAKEVVRSLITLFKGGSAINVTNADGDTPLHLAVAGRQNDIVIMLTNGGANPNIQDSHGHTPLHIAVQQQFPNIFRHLIEDVPNVNINIQDIDGLSPLIWAIVTRSEETALKLINKGADHSLRDVDALDALHYALQYKMQSIIDKIVSDMSTASTHASTMRISRIDPQKNTYLHWAFREGAPAVAEVLIGRGLSLNDENALGLTPLHFISKYDALYLYEFFRRKGQEGNLPTEITGGHTQLHLQAVSGNLMELKKLVEETDEKNNINTPTASGLKPIHLALHFNHPECAFYLLEQGAELTTNELNVHGAAKLRHDLQAVFVTQDKVKEQRQLAHNRILRVREQIQELQKKAAGNDARSQDRAIREETVKSANSKKETRMDDGINDATVRKRDGAKNFELPESYVPPMGLEDFLRQPKIKRLIESDGKQIMDHLIGEAKLFVKVKLTQIRQAKEKDDPFLGRYADMTFDQLLAIYVYTYECDIYKKVGNAVRKNIIEEIELWQPLIYYVVAALQSIPKETDGRKVFRGISVDVDPKLYEVGSTVNWASFSSASGDQSVAQSFLGDSSAGTVFIITTDTAASIQHFSAYPEEDEVLFPPNTEFKVMNVLSKGTAELLHLSSLIIELEETKTSADQFRKGKRK